MIPTGLKVGDTFEDNGTYKVTKVVGDNYESIRVETAPPYMPFVDNLKEDYDSMQYASLKKLCAERGLDARGSKSELIARLEG